MGGTSGVWGRYVNSLAVPFPGPAGPAGNPGRSSPTVCDALIVALSARHRRAGRLRRGYGSQGWLRRGYGSQGSVDPPAGGCKTQAFAVRE